MPSLKHILVPTDLSDGSLAAMKMARTLAKSFGATITLLYVIDNLPVLAYPLPAQFDYNSLFVDAKETAQMNLKLFVADRLNDDETIQRVVLMGTPHQEIISYAADHAQDIIVIATHGRTGLKHVLIGSVAERVVRFSPIPVVTVRSEI